MKPGEKVDWSQFRLPEKEAEAMGELPPPLEGERRESFTFSGYLKKHPNPDEGNARVVNPRPGRA